MRMLSTPAAAPGRENEVLSDGLCGRKCCDVSAGPVGGRSNCVLSGAVLLMVYRSLVGSAAVQNAGQRSQYWQQLLWNWRTAGCSARCDSASDSGALHPTS
jgi:hypothetical protein